MELFTEFKCFPEVRGIVVTEVGGGYSMPFQSSNKKTISPELREWARGAVRKILVILGDLSRYRTEFEPKQAAGVTTSQLILMHNFFACQAATDTDYRILGRIVCTMFGFNKELFLRYYKNLKVLIIRAATRN